MKLHRHTNASSMFTVQVAGFRYDATQVVYTAKHTTTGSDMAPS